MSMTETDIAQALKKPTYTNKETGITYTGRLLSLPQWLDFAADQKKLSNKEMTDAELVDYLQRFMRAVFPLPPRDTPFTSIKWLEAVRQARYVNSLKSFDDPVQHIMNDPQVIQVFTDFLEYQTSVLFRTTKS